jgi:hypothetical protein
MSKITYKYIASGTREFEQMQHFAETFDHAILPSPNVNLHALYNGEVLFGYGETVFLPVYYPAYHPDYTQPRDVMQTMSDWRSHIQISGKPGFIGVPLEADRPNFQNATMSKLGFQQMRRELFIPI